MAVGLVQHTDPAVCPHDGDHVCPDCCVCNAHAGCGCCDCPWFGKVA